MAQKTKKPTKKQAKKITLAREHVIIILLAIIAVFALGYFAFNQYQIRQEKQSFAEAELVLTQLSSDIQAKLGAPISSETTKQCAYASAKYTKGTPRCSVGFSLTYIAAGGSEIVLGSRITEVFSQTKTILLTGGNLTKESDFGSISNDFLIKDNPSSCGTSISADIEVTTKITIDVSCYKDSKNEHFPVKN